MSTRRIDRLRAKISARYRFVRHRLEPIADPEDPAIRWFLWMLDVPRRRIQEVTDYAARQALKLYSPKPPEIYLRAVTPEYTSKYFSIEFPKSNARARNGSHASRARKR